MARTYKLYYNHQTITITISRKRTELYINGRHLFTHIRTPFYLKPILFMKKLAMGFKKR